MIHTAESVTAWHPDKICDQVADAILDEYLRVDPYARVAVEVLGGHNSIVLIGEITSKESIDVCAVARDTYFNLTKKTIGVLSNIVKQSAEIAEGVDGGGAGDQGIMVGYACNENKAQIPHELYLARLLLAPYKTDGKAQVTTVSGVVTDVVLSVQNEKRRDLQKYVAGFLKDLDEVRQGMYNRVDIYCNNTGSFDVGGFDSDSGCTGRKIVIDAYGPRVPVGGGAFSGKDPTKVDRSGAYMARWLAKKYLKQTGGKRVIVKLAYAIGRAEPVMATWNVDGVESRVIQADYDCRPEAIIERFNLRMPIYLETARRGHFGVKNYPWEMV